MKLGIIGMSKGNGHPYSWSAIFNGYDAEFMVDCPFPVIPEYLSKRKFPEDGLGHLGVVTHVWTQDRSTSEHIAKAAKIEKVVDQQEDMLGEIDAVLLARDDAENHYDMALPFLKSGIPIYIDKPLALSVGEAERLLAAQEYEDQIFSCSPLRYAEELTLTEEEKQKTGKILHVEASTPKAWNNYAVHLIDPILKQMRDRGELKKISGSERSEIKSSLVEWESLTAFLKTTGKIAIPFKIQYFGENGTVEKNSVDAFTCFKKALLKFINLNKGEDRNIRREETLETIRIIEESRI